MTKLLQQAFDEALRLPEEKQDALAALLFAEMTRPDSRFMLSDEQVKEVERRRSGSSEPATDAKVAALWSSCGL